MSARSRVRVYVGCSFDGYIAGPDNDLSWLERDYSSETDLEPDPDALRFDQFLGEVGAMLMGRGTYDAVERMGQWPYGELPVLVATHRALTPMTQTVQAVAGPVAELVERAKSLAGDEDVYLDGGDLVRQALDAGLVDEITVTFVPVLLGGGTRLFEGLVSSTALHFVALRPFDRGMAQITVRFR